MSYEIQRGIWEAWYPGCQIDVQPGDPGTDDLLKAIKRVRVNSALCKLTLLALAANANPINSSLAMTWTKQENLTTMIGRKERTVRSVLSMLADSRDIYTQVCDGRYCTRDHGNSRHIFLYRPPAAPEWSLIGTRGSTRTYKTPRSKK